MTRATAAVSSELRFLCRSEREGASLSVRLNLSIIVAAVLLLVFGFVAVAECSPRGNVDDAYYGNYRATDGHMFGVDQFINDAGDRVALISDYQSGIVRQLFPISDSEFVMGPGFEVQSPVELKVRFVRDGGGKVTGVSLQPTGGQENFAKRVPLAQQEVVFSNGQVRLAGTLMIPAAKGLHPAIILLHGSGPLTRYSFGPYPHFFTSLGFAVLIFDKRGTGASTGTLLDASTGDLKSPPVTYYPDDMVNDALAAFRFLQGLKEINPREIGVWGSSEGGCSPRRSQRTARTWRSLSILRALWVRSGRRSSIKQARV
jgi:hypothetical protein